MALYSVFTKTVTTFGSRVVFTSSLRQCRSLTTEKNDDVNETHFGFQKIRTDLKTEKVREVFETVSNKYDVMNDVMSLGVHRVWKDIFIQRLAPTPGTTLLDVAGGTGDIAFRFLKYLKNRKINTIEQDIKSHVTVCDINEAMLNVGKARAENDEWLSSSEISWVQGNAEKLQMDNEFCSAYTIAFGIRNVTHIESALDEAYRVLKPGGRFMCLEFSHLNNQYLQWLYDHYSFQLIPVMGQLIAGEWRPYKYLVESIRQFPNQEDFKYMIECAGFKYVSYENLSFGIVAIHSGFKI